MIFRYLVVHSAKALSCVSCCTCLFRNRIINRMDKGFTLLEILVTIMIFALGVLSLAGLQILTLKNTSFNKEASVAAMHAQKKIEELKNTAFPSITPGTSTLSYAAGNQLDGVMTWSVTTLPVGAVFPNRYKDVSLCVCWACSTACGACDSGCTTCKKLEFRTMISE